MDKVPDGPLGLPQRIRALRAERKWGQRELAIRVRTHKACVFNWESNRNSPGMWMLVELSRVFEISLDDLLDVHFGKEQQDGRRSNC